MSVKNVSLTNLGNILKTPFMMPDSRELIKLGWNGDIIAFSEKLWKYVWARTRDYTMAIIMLTIVVAASKAKNIEIEEGVMLSDYINNKVEYKKIENLFSNIVNIKKSNDSNNIADSISKENKLHGWFAKCFMALLLASCDNKEKAETVFQNFLKQVKKMTKWAINQSYMEELTGVINKALNTKVKCEWQKKYVISEFYEKQKGLPYAARPFTKYEKSLLQSGIDTRDTLSHFDTWADVPISCLLRWLSNIEQYLSKKKQGKEEVPKKKKFKDITKFYQIRKTIEEELENRAAYYKSKKSMDDIDLLRIKQKMETFRKRGSFLQGDDLIRYYTDTGDIMINATSQNRLRMATKFDKQTEKKSAKELFEQGSKVPYDEIVPENMYAKTFLEIEAIRDMFKNADPKYIEGIWEDINERAPKWQKNTAPTVYRSMSMCKLMKSIVVKPGSEPPKKTWLNQENNTIAEDSDEVIKYLKDKCLFENRVLSTSLKWSGESPRDKYYPKVSLKIDISKYDKAILIDDKSTHPDEREVILHPSTKLKLVNITYDDNDTFYIDAIPYY